MLKSIKAVLSKNMKLTPNPKQKHLSFSSIKKAYLYLLSLDGIKKPLIAKCLQKKNL